MGYQLEGPGPREKSVPYRFLSARRSGGESVLVVDDTLCEHVGSLFEHIQRHSDHGEDHYPLAHNPVTSFYVIGVVRFPLCVRLYRRYEEVTNWEVYVK